MLVTTVSLFLTQVKGRLTMIVLEDYVMMLLLVMMKVLVKLFLKLL